MHTEEVKTTKTETVKKPVEHPHYVADPSIPTKFDTNDITTLVNGVTKVPGYGNSVVALVRGIAAMVGACKTDSSEIAALAARIDKMAPACAEACFAGAPGYTDPYAPGTRFAHDNAVTTTTTTKSTPK